MTQQEKQLLLKDLCARMPYGVNVRNVKMGFDIYDFNHNVKEIKTLIEEYGISPYLRPMSSMTDEDWNIFDSLAREPMQIELFEWLNSHHLDYRGLIEKGLALEAPEGMYKIK